MREVDFSQFYTIFRKIVRSRFPVRLFTAPSVLPDMQNTPPNFEILAVYFEAKRWYINFVRTFFGQRTCIHAATEERMLRGKSKAQKEKSLPQLNHFLAEKVAKSVVRSSFLVYHLFAVRIRRLILLCLRIVCRRPRHCPCLKCFHSGCKPDEKSDGPYHLTFPLQGSILRGSEIFGYDEKEYPERMQRAAGWCKAVQGVRGKILSELSG